MLPINAKHHCNTDFSKYYLPPTKLIQELTKWFYNCYKRSKSFHKDPKNTKISKLLKCWTIIVLNLIKQNCVLEMLLIFFLPHTYFI